MALDVATLFTVSTCIIGLLGACLLFAWVRDRSIRALAWWGAAYLIGGSAVALWSVQSAVPHLTAEAPNILLFLSCGLVWSGARLFRGGRPILVPILAGPVLWWTNDQLAVFASDGARIALSSAIIATYTFLTALELGRDRRKVRRRFHALLMPLLHATVFLSPILLIVSSPSGTPGLFSGWFAIFTLQTLLYAVGTAFIILIMAKEHSELIYKTAASTDALTGLFNRRTFFENAQTLITQLSRERETVTVLMFDLDHFKSINDRFGHAVGDDALQTFANTAVAQMRTGDIIARLGGEEFAAIVPGGMAAAVAIAERVRASFEKSGFHISGHPLKATVSIGAVCEPALGANIQRLLARADAALYTAKAAGRNRLHLAEPGLPEVMPAPGLIPQQCAA